MPSELVMILLQKIRYEKILTHLLPFLLYINVLFYFRSEYGYGFYP